MQRTLNNLAKTRDVSAPYILLSVLIVFHLLNAKAVVVSEITEAQTWCQRSHLLVKLSMCFWCYCKCGELRDEAPCSSMLSKYQWLSWVITRAWQSGTVWMLDLKLPGRQGSSRKIAPCMLEEWLLRNWGQGRFCVSAKAATGKTVLSRWLRFMGNSCCFYTHADTLSVLGYWRAVWPGLWEEGWTVFPSSKRLCMLST